MSVLKGFLFENENVLICSAGEKTEASCLSVVPLNTFLAISLFQCS